MTKEQICRAFWQEAGELDVCGGVGHMLLSAFPLTDDDRRLFRIQSPSQFLEDKTLRIIDTDMERARQHLFEIRVGLETAGCQALVSEPFDRFYQGLLADGGVWPLEKMTKHSATVGWVADANPSDLVLRAHRHMSVLTSANWGDEKASIPVMKFDKDHEPKELNTGVYHILERKNLTTFDSFFVLSATHVIGFQASISREHDVSAAGVAWMLCRGITKITYIYVTPDKATGECKVKVPVDQEQWFDGSYHLVLTF
ncbi:hypothetical protein C8R44DRAFT_303312 [Mycena epipterygia]|nr:hypothetical protein C8R44DRAFT_303312 [Mycena epipterygia]